MIGAFVAEIAVVVSLHVLEASHFLTLVLTELAGCAWWIVGFEKLARVREIREEIRRKIGAFCEEQCCVCT